MAKRIKEIEEEKEYQPKKPHPRILDPYHEQILKWIEEDLSGVRIHEKIQQKGVKVGYTTVKDYLSLIKKKDKVFIRIHTSPAEETQVDFGYVGYTSYEGKRRKTWVFNMRLSYSRLTTMRWYMINGWRPLSFVISMPFTSVYVTLKLLHCFS